MFGNPQQNQNQGGVFGNIKSAIMQIAVMWLVINLVFKKGGVVVEEINQKTGEKQIKVQPTLPTTCLFKPHEMMNLKVYVSEGEEFHNFDPKKLIWQESKLFLGDRESNSRTTDVNITASHNLQNNGTMFAYLYLYKAGFQPDPSKKPYAKEAVIEVRYELVKYFFEKKDNKINLMSGDEPEVKDLSERRILGHWKDNITLALVTDTQPLQLASITPQMAKHMLINKESNTYYPTFYVNDFWTYRDHYYPINDTLSVLPLRIVFETKEMWKWTLMVQMEESFLMQREWGATNDGDSDDVKRMISETNLWLLALTGFVSILHMTFDFLAFKNDIQFWKNRKDMKGLSIRTIFINFFCQIIIFLYLLDNDTSWMILLSSGVGLLIEGWKITRTTNVKVKNTFPFLSIEDKESYNETKEYDKQAMTYLTYILFPLILCYSIYSLIYKTHKSWYSWILSSLTGAVYTFGFILMTPQLFLNYKFKTVAHLPWRVFVYKALNTFVDDLFAFIIKMPLLHRLSCFRDDLIFLIFLYQRWIYPVDKSRTNEFGQSFEDDPNNTVAVDNNKVDVKDENGETKKDK